ncbi:MAG: hypothetical protein ACRD29_08990 [Acidimicrobiales bacterium]
MSAGDAAAVIVACASGAALVVMVWAIVALTRTLRQLRDTIAEVRARTLPVVDDLRVAVDRARAELARADEMLGTAEKVTARADSASRVAHMAVVNPMIKAMAAVSGTGTAARGLRRRRTNQEGE